jgi:cbb3-type cytochrome oxidase maturation protein
MTGLVILIPVALFLGALGLVAFLWSLRSGQYEDLDGAAVRILDENEVEPGFIRSSAVQGCVERPTRRPVQTIRRSTATIGEQTKPPVHRGSR